MSLKIPIKSVDEKPERIAVHSIHHDTPQANYQPSKASYDDDVARLSIRDFTNT